MNRSIQFVILLAFGGVLCDLQATYAQPDSENGIMDKQNILLKKDELSGIVIHRTQERPWVTGIPPNGEPSSSHGVLQEVEIEGVKVRIRYAEFQSEVEARQAADFHIHNVASIFQKGFWDVAKRESIGDESWYTRSPAALAVLVRSGNVCFLISVREGDFEKQAHIAEILAERLTSKAKHGARVPASGAFRK
jgi:hypothetical protein